MATAAKRQVVRFFFLQSHTRRLWEWAFYHAVADGRPGLHLPTVVDSLQGHPVDQAAASSMHLADSSDGFVSTLPRRSGGDGSLPTSAGMRGVRDTVPAVVVRESVEGARGSAPVSVGGVAPVRPVVSSSRSDTIISILRSQGVS